MARRSTSFQARVAFIAVIMLAAFSALLVALSRLGSPTRPLPDAPGPAAIVEAPGQAAELTQEPAQPLIDMLGVETERVTLQLFMIDQVNRRLTPRVLRRQAPMTLAAQAEVALRELIAASGVGYLSPLPPDTILREVWVSPGGIATVDFAAGFPDLVGGGSMNEIQAVYGVVGTLTASFPEIQLVQFLIDGRPVETLNGHLDLSLPLGPLSDWLY